MIKTKTSKLAGLFIVTAFLLPAFAQAESTGTGSIAASQAAEQKAALAKKSAERQARKAAAEQLKATQTPTPAPGQVVTETPKVETPAAQ